MKKMPFKCVFCNDPTNALYSLTGRDNLHPVCSLCAKENPDMKTHPDEEKKRKIQRQLVKRLADKYAEESVDLKDYCNRIAFFLMNYFEMSVDETHSRVLEVRKRVLLLRKVAKIKNKKNKIPHNACKCGEGGEKTNS